MSEGMGIGLEIGQQTQSVCDKNMLWFLWFKHINLMENCERYWSYARMLETSIINIYEL